MFRLPSDCLDSDIVIPCHEAVMVIVTLNFLLEVKNLFATGVDNPVKIYTVNFQYYLSGSGLPQGCTDEPHMFRICNIGWFC